MRPYPAGTIVLGGFQTEDMSENLPTGTIEFCYGNGIHDEADKLDCLCDSMKDSKVNSDEYDTDLDSSNVAHVIKRKDAAVKPRQSSSSVYELACVEDDQTPHSAMVTGLSQPTLVLRYRSIGSQAMKPLCTALIGNDIVTVLDLEDTDIGHEGALYLAATLRENFVIRHLNIANNQVGDEGIGAITNTLCHNTTIKYLNISGNKLTDNFGKTLSTLLTENDSVTCLHANYNSMRQKSAIELGKALSVNDSLEHLDLSWNCFTGQSAVRLFAGLQKNTCLKLLDLSRNGIGYDGGASVYIDVSNTRIMWQNTESLAWGIRCNDVLKVLKLGGNPLTTTGSLTLLEGIGEDTCSLELFDITGVPVVAEFPMLGTAIQRTRPFQFHHGTIVNSHDYLGRQVLGTVAGGSGTTIKHPMQVVLEFLRQRQIRLLELFRSMDKSVLLHMTDEAFANRLKRFGLPLYEHEIRKLTRAIAGKGDDKSTVTYPKLVRTMADHILRQRSKKQQRPQVKRRTEADSREYVQHLRLRNAQWRTEGQSIRRTNSKKKLPKLNKAPADFKTTE